MALATADFERGVHGATILTAFPGSDTPWDASDQIGYTGSGAG